MRLNQFLRINFFWRTFVLLLILLLASALTWLLIFRNIDTESTTNYVWFYWSVTAIVLSLFGSAVVASLINRPLRLLSQAADQVRTGNFAGSRLDESILTTDINNAFRGFNQMTDQLSKVEADRTIMLAGISHDLRTPLARLRLETELSVADANARKEMSADIEQINNVISKFLDYARPNFADLRPVLLADVAEHAIKIANTNAKDTLDLIVEHQIPPTLKVLADPVELQRVLANLIENARRYGKAPITMAEFSTLSAMRVTNQDAYWSPTLLFDHSIEVAHVHINARVKNEWVVLSVRDHGAGAPPNVLNQLRTPFFRANNARSDVTGSGLGLAIVEKAVQGMQGNMRLSNIVSQTDKHSDDPTLTNLLQDNLKPYSGFLVEIRLKHAQPT